MAFATTTISGLNANSGGATTASVNVTAATMVSWCVVGVTGTHSNHKITVQISFDNVTFLDAPSKLTGTGVYSTLSDVGVGYLRFKVETVEGAVSTVNIIINAK